MNLDEIRSRQRAMVGPVAFERACTGSPYSPLDVAVALSLYAYNVSAAERAQRLYDHFDGECAEVDDMRLLLARNSVFAPTEFAPPTAALYVAQALDQYAQDAMNRNEGNGLKE